MTAHCLRLVPGLDLKRALDRLALEGGWSAACVVSGIGSLGEAAIRFAGAEAPTLLRGPLEILSLGGTLSRDGSHLHILVADADGTPRGGHLAEGSTVRTTAEIVLALLPEWEFRRTIDPETGWKELAVEALATVDEDSGRRPGDRLSRP